MPDPTSKVSPRRLGVIGVVAVVGLAAVVVTGITTRSNGDVKLREWTEAQAMPSVAVALPGTKPLNATLDLPGGWKPIRAHRSTRASAVISRAGRSISVRR